MRRVQGGDGSDTTTATLAALAATKQYRFPTLYMIGEPSDPSVLMLTDWDAPLVWSVYGTFKPSAIVRGKVTSQVGLQVQTLDIQWSPPIGTFVNALAADSPYRQVRLGWFDNKPVRVWSCFMLVQGDANTYGCCELFGGHVADATLQRGKITFTVNSWLDALDQQVPGAVIEAANTAASSGGAIPPAGTATVPQFLVAPSGSSQVLILGDCTGPVAHHIFTTDVFVNGFLVFNGGAGSTLQGQFSAVAHNYDIVVGGIHYNAFRIYSPMPWIPAAGVDTFYVSAAWPYNQSDGSYYGFPFVPDPESAF